MFKNFLSILKTKLKIAIMTIHAFSMYPLIFYQVVSIELKSKKSGITDEMRKCRR